MVDYNSVIDSIVLGNKVSMDQNKNLGKRKREDASSTFPDKKINKTDAGAITKLDDDTWDISLSNAKKPDLKGIQASDINIESIRKFPSAPRRVYRTNGKKKGEGTFGLVFEVSDVDHPDKSLVMKICIAESSSFFNEVTALERLAMKKNTPNIPAVHDWFISDELPKTRSKAWKMVHEYVANASQFRKLLTKPKPFGYLVMERADGGTMASFFDDYIAKAQSIEHIWYTLDITMFQLIYNVAALPASQLLHRDLGASNNILITTLHHQQQYPPVPDGASDNTRYWHFKVGDNLFRFPTPHFKPIIIDYGTAKLLYTNCSFKTDFRHTTLRYRAPELIFITAVPGGQLQPWFTSSTDLFSIAMSILETIFGDYTKKSPNNEQYFCHPFMRYNPPSNLQQKLEALCDQLLEDENKSTEQPQKDWIRMIRKGFIDKSECALLSRYLWGMYYELGIPNNQIWPGVEETHIWKVMEDVIRQRKENNMGAPPGHFSLFKHAKLKQYLSPSQREMLKDMLQFNPKSRPCPTDLLTSDAFRHLRFSVDNAQRENFYPCWSVSIKTSVSWANKQKRPPPTQKPQNQ